MLTTAGLALTSSDEPLHTPAAELAVELDILLDVEETRGTAPTLEVTQESVIAWAFEILPYFEYEGVTATAILPDSIKLVAYQAASEHFHLLGRAYCTPDGGGPVELNARVANPVSAWYGRTTVLATLVHELAHVQGGGFCKGSSEELESTTQIVTLEVLAAMANGGNRIALYALLEELRDMAMAAARYDAMASGDDEAYALLQRIVYDTPEEQARSAKSARRWVGDTVQLKEILYKYSKIPMTKILRGLQSGKIPNLRMGPEPYTGGGFYVPDNRPRTLVIDDLVYVLEHAEEMLDQGPGGVLGPHQPK